MSADVIELYDYLIHEGQVDGQTVCAMLWTGHEWPYQGNPRICQSPADGGYQDLLIEADEGRLLLKSIQRRLLQQIIEKGLYIIYQDVTGTRHTHIPPSGRVE